MQIMPREKDPVLEIDPDDTLAAREEKIATLLYQSERFRWRAFLELLHIKQTKQYLEHVTPDGSPVFSTFEEYIEDLRERIPAMSRRNIYGRIGVLNKLHCGLGVPMEEIIGRPPTALEAATRLGTWDREGNLLPPESGGTGTAEEIKTFLEETRHLPAGDTVALVDEKLGKDRILFYGSRTTFQNGDVQIQIRILETGSGALWFVNGLVSGPVAQELEKKLGLVFEEKETTESDEAWLTRAI